MSDVINLGGSIKRKETNPDLLEERAKRTFNGEELENFLMEESLKNFQDKFAVVFKENPGLAAEFSYYDMTREEKQELWWKRVNILRASKDGKDFFENTHPDFFGFWSTLFPGISPLSVHTSMFHKSIEFLGSEEQ